MSHAALTAQDIAALRHSIQASIARLDDAARVIAEIGAVDLLDEALPVLAVFFEEFGRHHLVNTLTDALVAHILEIDSVAAAFAFPRPGQVSPSAATAGPESLRIDALLRVAGPLPAQVVLPLESGAVIAPLSELTPTPVAGFDVDGGWHRVRADVDRDALSTVDTEKWSRAQALIRLSLGSEILGAAMQINAIAVGHVTERRQFGKPLGSFQSVRHRLAESHVAIQAAQTVLDLAWSTADTDTAETVIHYGVAAKAMAGRAFESSARNANQVCGGMGLTQEHSLPAFIRRGSALNVLLGDPTDLTASIGYDLCHAVALPRPDPLREPVGAR